VAVGLWNYNLDNRCPYSENNAFIYRDRCNKFSLLKLTTMKLVAKLYSHPTLLPDLGND